MRLLLDTHILIAIARREAAIRYPAAAGMLDNEEIEIWVSAASIWEIAIEVRLGKLNARMQLDDLTPYFATLGMKLLRVDFSHVVAEVVPKPATRDPFDNLLLAQCLVEDFGS